MLKYLGRSVHSESAGAVAHQPSHQVLQDPNQQSSPGETSKWFVHVPFCHVTLVITRINAPLGLPSPEHRNRSRYSVIDHCSFTVLTGLRMKTNPKKTGIHQAEFVTKYVEKWLDYIDVY
tara:strand:- start:130 stop:489 length:360 start_codon:yes stop_codon:yes gene_type:complete